MRAFLIVMMAIRLFGAGAQQHAMMQYSVNDGLPQSQVNMVVEDVYGYLWIATHGGGLARFDGREFKIYTTRDGLLNNVIHYLKIDSKNNLWIVHPKGLTRFDGRNFKAFQQPGTPVRRVRRVFEAKDTIYLVNSQGTLGAIHQDSAVYWNKPLLPDKMILYTHRTPNNEICLYLNDSSFLVMTKSQRIAISHKKYFGRLQNIFNKGKDIVVKTDQGVFQLDIQQRTFGQYNLPVENHVLAYDERDHSYWTRHEDDLLVERFENNVHQIDTVSHEIPITQIFFDSEGNTWIGTSGKGLYKYFIQDFDRWLLPKRVESVTAIQKDKRGNFWVGTMNRGLWRVSEDGAKEYKVNALNDYNVNAIKVDEGDRVWIGAYGGLARYDQNTDEFKWFSRPEGLPSSYINQLEVDNQQRVWYATQGGGAGYYKGGVFHNFDVATGLTARNISAIKFSPYHQTVFLGGENGLFSVYEGEIKTVQIPEFENTSILSINPYKEKWLLLGSGGAGVIIWNPTTGKRVLLDSRNGLASDFIYFVAADDKSRIWVGTEKGVSKLRLSDNFEIQEHLHFGVENGLAGLQTNQNAFYLGEVNCFGLVDGVYQFNDLRHEELYSFPLHITSVDIFNGQYSTLDYAGALQGFFHVPSQLKLPFDKNYLTFHFNRVDKRYPKSVQFQYLLENFDKTWSTPSSTNAVTYSNLPPGAYMLRVRTTDKTGSWSKTVLSYPFKVQAPFYRTLPFQAFAVAFLAGSTGLFLYLRVRQKIRLMMRVERIRQQEQDKIRKEIARDFHDEMGNQLTRIINYISLIKLNGADKAHQHELYNKVEESAKYLYNGTRDFIWSIDPLNDELSRLFIHIRDFGEKLFSEKEISFRAYNHLGHPVHVSYGFSREANLIFKEAMTNAFNHSRAKNVSFVLKEEDEKMVMELQDDGQGFLVHQLEKLNGIKNMRSRAERIHAAVRIRSMPQAGTTISLIFSSKIHKTDINHV